MSMKREYSPRFITIIQNNPNSNVEERIKELKTEYGPIRLRGRHHNRKWLYEQLNMGYRPGTQNDVPWRYGERIAVYKRIDRKWKS